MATSTLEREREEEQTRLRHQRYEDFIGKDAYERRAEATFGTATAERPAPHSTPADRIKDASQISRGVFDYPYSPGYKSPAPEWSYVPAPPVQNEPEQEYRVPEEENPDLQPSLTTQQYATRQGEAASEDYGFRLTASSRIVIAVFFTMLIAIVSLLCINSSVIRSLAHETAALEESYTQLVSREGELNAAIDDARGADAIRAYAESVGMVLGD